VKLRLGTRGSALALAQAELVASALERAEPDVEVELVPLRTSGDERRRARETGRPVGKGPAPGSGDPPPPGGGDKARFVKEIEEALLAEEVDLAVHSAKDVPSELPEGLAIVGVPERADARDSLCSARTRDDAAEVAGGLDELPEGGRVGTSSLRRRAQLLGARPDLDVRELRGNVDTRLTRLAEGDYDALVLAAAGLARLGRREGVAIPIDQMTPAPGQGCLALEARKGDERAAALAGRVTDGDSLVRLTAERAVVAGLDASCRTPVGAHAELLDGALSVTAFVGLPDGSAWVRDSLAGDPAGAARLGGDVAGRLLAAGAADVLAAAERVGRA
jgi:hydroxymethylbilane synthase